MEGLSVVVGTSAYTTLGRECNIEIDLLAKKIAENGYSVERTNHPWPRDLYVYCDGRYVKRPAGEGGCILEGKGCLLVSEAILRHKSYAPNKIKNKAKLSYPGRRIHLMPSGYNPNEAKYLEGATDVNHIDLTCLLVPSRNLLIVDQSFYRRNYFIPDNPKRKFTEVAEKEGLKLEFYNPHSGSSYKYFPANCLVLPKDNGEDIVFANSNIKPFLRLLSKYDVNFVEVDFKFSQKQLGSIRCRTNVKEKKKSLDLLF